MFTVAERDRVRERLLALAAADPGIVGAAVTGSAASGGADRWSDIDLAFAVDGDLGAALERWTGWIHADFGALHHWDLPAGPTVYRVFLLPGLLEVDIGFSPAADFAPRGPHWRTAFGDHAPPVPAASPDPAHLIGLAWHHALHARACVERQRWWAAEHWISALRDHVIALACLRLGHPAGHARGAHLLPAPLAASLADSLIRSLDETELRRALAAAVTALAAELTRTDPALADRLRDTLTEAGGSGT